MAKGMNIAILSESLIAAEEITAIFKKLEITAHYFSAVEDFWYAVMSDSPELSFVDVRNMSQGHLIIKEHPNYITNNLPLAFLYDDTSKPLLSSTYDFDHFGLIDLGSPIEGQSKAILKRLNRYNQLANKVKELERENFNVGERNYKLVQDNNIKRTHLQYEELQEQTLENLYLGIKENSFFESLSNVMTSWTDVSEFCLVELSQTKHKLISPLINSRKYRHMPSLWLGKACPKGIEYFAQNMASQVAADLLGGSTLSLKVFGLEKNPDILIFIKTNDVLKSAFNWPLFEKNLTGVYSSWLLSREKNNAKDEFELNTFELMSRFEADNSLDSKESYIGLDLIDLLQEINIHSQGAFYWKDFFKAFTNKLKRLSDIDFKICTYNIRHLVLVVQSEYASSLAKQLKFIVEDFDYWRFFENSDAALAIQIRPLIRTIPNTITGFIEYLNISEDNASTPPTFLPQQRELPQTYEI